MKIIESVKNIEKIELELTLFNSKRALSNVEKRLEILLLGSSILLKDLSSPQSGYYNRIKGFTAADIDIIDQILKFYENDGITPCFDLAPNHSNFDVATTLTKKGFYNAEQLAFLEITPEPTPISYEHLKIVQITEENAVEFIKLIGTSNGIKYEQDLINKKAHFFQQPNFINYIIYIEDKPAGMGSLFIHEKAGYIANDFTFPEFRGKGCQSALIQHRLQVAKELDLHKVYTDVEFGSTSHNNMHKIGFQLVCVNSTWRLFSRI